MVEIRKTPLVSVITPVYNGEKYIEELILSVLNQDYSLIEHIIIDDGSTDRTVEILKRYSHLRWLSRENRGQYATMNEGLAQANGEIINFIAADDLYATPSTVSNVVNFWNAHPKYQIIYGGTLQIDANSIELPVQTILFLPIPKLFLRYFCFIPHSSLFVDKRLIIQNNIYFDEELRFSGDWDWIIRLSKTDANFGFSKFYLSKYRIDTGQTSLSFQNPAFQNEKLLVLNRYSVDSKIFLLVKYLLYIHSLIKQLLWIVKRKGILAGLKEIKNWVIKKLYK